MFASFAAIPFGPELTFEPGLSAGVFWLLAILSVEVIGVILAGWASNNKWSVYGAIREACQMVCYEVPLGLSIIVGVMTAGTLSLVRLGLIQGGGVQTWLAFRNPFTLAAFAVYFIASLAANKRAPFDLPEGDSELVAGYHTEYSGLRFSLFFFAEYAGHVPRRWPFRRPCSSAAGTTRSDVIGYWHRACCSARPTVPVLPLLAVEPRRGRRLRRQVRVARISADLGPVDVPAAADRPGAVRLREGAAPGWRALLLAGGAALWQLFLPERAGVPWRRLPAVGTIRDWAAERRGAPL